MYRKRPSSALCSRRWFQFLILNILLSFAVAAGGRSLTNWSDTACTKTSSESGQPAQSSSEGSSEDTGCSSSSSSKRKRKKYRPPPPPPPPPPPQKSSKPTQAPEDSSSTTDQSSSTDSSGKDEVIGSAGSAWQPGADKKQPSSKGDSSGSSAADVASAASADTSGGALVTGSSDSSAGGDGSSGSADSTGDSGSGNGSDGSSSGGGNNAPATSDSQGNTWPFPKISFPDGSGQSGGSTAGQPDGASQQDGNQQSGQAGQDGSGQDGSSQGAGQGSGQGAGQGAGQDDGVIQGGAGQQGATDGQGAGQQGGQGDQGTGQQDGQGTDQQDGQTAAKAGQGAGQQDAKVGQGSKAGQGAGAKAGQGAGQQGAQDGQGAGQQGAQDGEGAGQQGAKAGQGAGQQGAQDGQGAGQQGGKAGQGAGQQDGQGAGQDGQGAGQDGQGAGQDGQGAGQDGGQDGAGQEGAGQQGGAGSDGAGKTAGKTGGAGGIDQTGHWNATLGHNATRLNSTFGPGSRNRTSPPPPKAGSGKGGHYLGTTASTSSNSTFDPYNPFANFPPSKPTAGSAQNATDGPMPGVGQNATTTGDGQNATTTGVESPNANSTTARSSIADGMNPKKSKASGKCDNCPLLLGVAITTGTLVLVIIALFSWWMINRVNRRRSLEQDPLQVPIQGAAARTNSDPSVASDVMAATPHADVSLLPGGMEHRAPGSNMGGSTDRSAKDNSSAPQGERNWWNGKQNLNASVEHNKLDGKLGGSDVGSVGGREPSFAQRGVTVDGKSDKKARASFDSQQVDSQGDESFDEQVDGVHHEQKKWYNRRASQYRQGHDPRHGSKHKDKRHGSGSYDEEHGYHDDQAFYDKSGGHAYEHHHSEDPAYVHRMPDSVDVSQEYSLVDRNSRDQSFYHRALNNVSMVFQSGSWSKGEKGLRGSKGSSQGSGANGSFASDAGMALPPKPETYSRDDSQPDTHSQGATYRTESVNGDSLKDEYSRSHVPVVPRQRLDSDQIGSDSGPSLYDWYKLPRPKNRASMASSKGGSLRGSKQKGDVSVHSDVRSQHPLPPIPPASTEPAPAAPAPTDSHESSAKCDVSIYPSNQTFNSISSQSTDVRSSVQTTAAGVDQGHERVNPITVQLSPNKTLKASELQVLSHINGTINPSRNKPPLPETQIPPASTTFENPAFRNVQQSSSGSERSSGSKARLSALYSAPAALTKSLRGMVSGKGGSKGGDAGPQAEAEVGAVAGREGSFASDVSSADSYCGIREPPLSPGDYDIEKAQQQNESRHTNRKLHSAPAVMNEDEQAAVPVPARVENSLDLGHKAKREVAVVETSSSWDGIKVLFHSLERFLTGGKVSRWTFARQMRAVDGRELRPSPMVFLEPGMSIGDSGYKVTHIISNGAQNTSQVVQVLNTTSLRRSNGNVAPSSVAVMKVHTNPGLFRHELGAYFKLKGNKHIAEVLDHVQFPKETPPWWGIMLEAGTVNLKDYLLHSRMTAEDQKDLVLQISRALESMHVNRLAHRHLSPSNVVFFNEQSTWKLVDFAATALEGNTAPVVGCVRYSAPEVAAAIMKAESTIIAQASADCWSLGVISYEVLTGKPLFDENENDEDILKILLGEVALPMESIRRLELLDPWARQLVDALLQRDPEQRWTAGDACSWIDSQA